MAQVSSPYVICIDRGDYRVALEIGKVYRALPDPDADELEMIRVIDESGEDYLFPNDYFAPIQLPQDIAKAIFTKRDILE